MNKTQIINQLANICEESSQFIREHFRKVSDEQIESKSQNSLVSFVDKGAEKMITDSLSTILPQAGFITEENMVKNIKKEFNWIVDPLDGTTNFVVGIPHFGISIALVHGNEIILGCVYDVMQQEFYHSIKNEGAYMDNRPIRVSSTDELNKSSIATGFPYDKELIGDSHFNALQYFLKNARILRRLGSASLDLCLVARGTFDLYYERYLNAWDLAAGALIVEEAGGKIMDLDGKRSFLEKGEIIAYSPGMDKYAMKTLGFFQN